MTVAAYDPSLVEQIASQLDLREPNRAALDALAQALGTALDGAEIVADLATGVGKTYIAGGLLDYLYEAGVRNVVIITPGSTIQRKTIDNLTPGHPKYLRGMASRPVVITLDDVERGTIGQALDDPDAFKVFVFTVQSLLRPDTKDARRAHRPHEMLGQSMSEYLRSVDDLVVIADEHHVYFSSNAKKFRAAITDLNPAALVGLTATPHDTTPPEAIVFRYPLADAIADGYVKVPVLVARTDGMSDQRTQMADGIALLDAKAAAMRAYCAQTRQKYIEPVMFVVASTIDEANRLRDMLAGPDLLGGDDKVLLVTSEEPDETLRLLDGIEEPDSGIRAVVSVSMLKEGWDVKSIYVIASVRSMESQLLTEQVLGRGLRLPFGRRTGVGMLDTVEVLSHHAFAELLEQAEVLLMQTLGDRAEAATASPVVTPGVGEVGVSIEAAAAAVAADGAWQVVIGLPGRAAREADPNQPGLFDATDDAAGSDGAEAHQVGGLATIQARLDAAAATTTTLSTPMVARAIGGVRVPLFIPQVTTKWVRDSFSLASVNLIDIEALGAQFASDHAPTLTRKALDAVRDDAGDVHVQVSDRSAAEQVIASQPRLPFATIQGDLVERLIATNDVAATITEANASVGIARAFMKGAGVTEDTPWRAEHGRLATAALVSWLRTKQTTRPAREVVEITQVRWPDPLETTLTIPPTSRHLVTGRPKFVRSHPYSGWTRSVYDAVTFDAYSTEFRLAELFDTSAGVKAWARVTNTVPLAIPYLVGAIQRTYMPDFIVIDDTGVLWIVEGKADSDMTDTVVLAKRDAAKAWVNAVNASPDVAARWGYVLSSETVIAAAGGNWAALKAASQTHGG
jgi:type III restriction enzyme